MVPSCLSWNDRKWCQRVQSSWSLLLFLTSAIWLHSLFVVHYQPAGHLHISASRPWASLGQQPPLGLEELLRLPWRYNSRETLSIIFSEKSSNHMERPSTFFSVIELWCKKEESKNYSRLTVCMGEQSPQMLYAAVVFFKELSLSYFYLKQNNCLW